MEDAKARVAALLGLTGEAEAVSAAGDPRTGHAEEVKARALVEKAERLLEQANEEDREDMIDLIEAIKDGLTAQDAAAVESASERLADILYYLDN